MASFNDKTAANRIAPHGNRITANIGLVQNWVTTNSPDPRSDVDELIEQDDMLRIVRDGAARQLVSIDCGDLYRTIEELDTRFGSIDPSLPENSDALPGEVTSRNDYRISAAGWKWYDARYMIATALGAPRPEWDGSTHSWWMDREHGNPLDASMTPAEVAAIPVPDWNSLPQVQEMLESRKRWKEAFPGDDPRFSNISQLSVHAGEMRWFLGYPSFVDLGIFLLGTTDFLTELGMASELADALMEKCFELSTSYIDFIYSVNPVEMELLLGFAGDTACLLSPELYRKYSTRWDAMLFAYVRNRYGCADDFPCNLHSCGPSVHLYDSWGEHPHNDQIVVLQTRLVPGCVKNLRRNMKKTVLQLTLHPQHYDVTNAPSEEWKQLLIESADAAETDNIHFSVIAVANTPEQIVPLRKNLDVMVEVLEEMNA